MSVGWFVQGVVSCFSRFLLRLFLTASLTGSVKVMAGNVQASIRSVSNGVEIRFNTAIGRNYEIFDSTNLTGWTPMELAIAGNGAQIVRTYPITGMPRRFFRVYDVTVPAGFVSVPAGGFTMGNNIAADNISDAPSHQVTVSVFYMAANLVTKTEWDTVRSWAIGNGYTDLAAGAGKAASHPVQTVSWWDCIKYCNARSQKEGLTPVYTVGGVVMKTGTTVPSVNWAANGYRLPTEAEWEKAARGGLSGKRFPWGDTISQSQANYFALDFYSYDLSGAVNGYHPTYAVNGFPYTSPVGSFAANGLGLRDMAGNVWQWCWDWYGAYDTGSPTDPRGAASGLYRVIRGGSWYFYAEHCRVAARNATPPDNFSDYFGFRVVLGTLR
jgi:formylglycine-generating enzyme required for sulfatase activity